MENGTILYFFITAVLVIALFTIPAIAFFYRNFFYPSLVRRCSRPYLPAVAVFIPCKGINKHLERNISSFVNLDYENLNIYFIVESDEDSAYPVIKKVIESSDRSHCVIAGLAETCGQKNHNLVKAVENAGHKADVYVFFDSDIPVSHKWMDDLLLPLSIPENTVATGFRWLHLENAGYGEKLHAFMNGVMWNLMQLPSQSVWGGCMAVRRNDFERLNISSYWLKTVSDDMGLQEIILRSGNKAVFVPECVAETDDTIHSFTNAVGWFKRQSQVVKYHLRPLWYTSLLLFISASLNLLFSIYTAAGYFSSRPAVFFCACFYIIMLMIWGAFLKKKSADGHSILLWSILAPVHILAGTWALILSIFSNRIKWSGIIYYMAPDGTVLKTVRK